MALLENDFKPLPAGEQKTNILSAKTAKIKNYTRKILSKLASAIFLLGRKSLELINLFRELNGLIKSNLEPVFNFAKVYLPHLIVAGITFVVVLSNLVVRYARADINDFLVVQPSDEINVTKNVDRYTPLISGGANAVEAAYAAPSDAFVQTNSTVATAFTEREEPLPDNSTSQVYYTVRNGDTLTSLGWKFNIKLATLKYVNDLDAVDLIKPGQQLKIPQAGYEVSASQIAAKENQKKQLASASRGTSYKTLSSASVSYAAGSRNNGYPYGYCTYYVATRRAVPSSWGNAKSWLYSAGASGYGTGDDPAVGAIVVTSESWWGHVGYVEDIGNGYITISEMNYNGWGVVNRRTIPAYSGVIRGYIY